jgi:hypothetical protein
MAKKKDPLSHLLGPHSKTWTPSEVAVFVQAKLYTKEECRELALRGFTAADVRGLLGM